MVVSNYVSSWNTLKFDYVVGVIIRAEIQRKKTGDTSGNVLTMEKSGRQSERGNTLGSLIKYINDRSKSILWRIECWDCGKRGNLKNYCEAPNKKGDRKQKTTQEANVAGELLQDVLIIALDNTGD